MAKTLEQLREDRDGYIRLLDLIRLAGNVIDRAAKIKIVVLIIESLNNEILGRKSS